MSDDRLEVEVKDTCPFCPRLEEHRHLFVDIATLPAQDEIDVEAMIDGKTTLACIRAEVTAERTTAILDRIKELGRSRRLVAAAQVNRTTRQFIAREAGTLEDIAATLEREFLPAPPSYTELGLALGYFIQCRAGAGDIAFWWKPNRNGYTTNIDEAGVYALDDVRDAYPDVNIPWPVEAVRPLAHRVVDLDKLRELAPKEPSRG